MANIEIQTWLDSPTKDYQQGVALLEKYSSNARLVHVYRNSSPRFQLQNLVGDLKRLLSVPAKEDALPTAASTPRTPAPAQTTIAQKDDTPPEIKAKIERAGKLWVKICKTHTELYNVGESNSPEAVEKRKNLLEKRVPEIEEYENLWKEIKAWQDTKLIPQPSPKKQPKESAELPKKSTKELMNLRQSLRMKITRANNQLQYQSKTKQEKKNPMPDGPKKEKLKQELSKNKALLDAVENELAKR